eukprot:GHVS01034080.1.p2 GENE.GHVS01034080.1~~GHVS01034080.1.p2  ORF type:complete len:133 (-),score=13.23 GHVS01034080.1:121-519(-)
MGCACTSPPVYEPQSDSLSATCRRDKPKGSRGQTTSYPSTGKRKQPGKNRVGRGASREGGRTIGGTGPSPEDTVDLRKIRAEAAEKRRKAEETRGGVSSNRMEQIKLKEKQELEELRKGKPSRTEDVLKMFD